MHTLLGDPTSARLHACGEIVSGGHACMHAETLCLRSAPVSRVHVAHGNHPAQAGKCGSLGIPCGVRRRHAHRAVHFRQAERAIADTPALQQRRLLLLARGTAGRHPAQRLLRCRPLHAQHAWSLLLQGHKAHLCALPHNLGLCMLGAFGASRHIAGILGCAERRRTAVSQSETRDQWGTSSNLGL